MTLARKYNATTSPQSDFALDVASGFYSNIKTQFKFGRSDVIGSSESVVWDGGGDYTFLDAAEFINVSSTSALDVNAGTGAWNIVISGLDSNYNEQTELIVLNGTTAVQSTNKYLRLFRAFILEGGTTTAVRGANQGLINMISADTTTLQARIHISEGQTLMAVYTVPAGKTAYISGGLFSVGAGKDCIFRGKFRNCLSPNCVFSNKFTIEMYEASQQAIFNTPLRVPEKTDMVITAQNGSPAISASASFGLILIDNE